MKAVTFSSNKFQADYDAVKKECDGLDLSIRQIKQSIESKGREPFTV
jgi:hypothetical protein